MLEKLVEVVEVNEAVATNKKSYQREKKPFPHLQNSVIFSVIAVLNMVDKLLLD